jgi:hypothetical protein
MEHTFNYRGYVNSIKINPDEYLMPLFEVVVNSIQSIEDKSDDSIGIISIKVIRDKQRAIEIDDMAPYQPITGFEICDNGVGFVEQRLHAFNDAFTDFNAKKGCKGVGRYTVLACFGSMDINSTFLENGNWYNRNFRFDNVKAIGSERDENKVLSKDHKLSTKVCLNNYKKHYQDFINKEHVEIKDIATDIIEHCLPYFINSKTMPLIRIYDEDDTHHSLLLNDIYKDIIKFDKKSNPMHINGIESDFNLFYLRNYSNEAHSFHLCANNREVGRKITISKCIPSFVQRLIDDETGKKYSISVYVTGNFLDEKANNQRNEFSIPTKKDMVNALDIISIEELMENFSEDVRNQYSDFIATVDKEKNDRIRGYILNYKTPRLVYKHLLSIEHIFDDIPANVTDEKLEAYLHKKVFMLEQNRTKSFNKIFGKKQYNKDEFSRILRDVLHEEAAFSFDKLADLLIRRKVIINLFRQYLDWRDEDSYMREEDLHNIIFTMGATTDTIPNDYHNLWLLDERLSFYHRTVSDKQLRLNNDFGTDSLKEPDLLIYDFPWAYSDNPQKVNSLVIFEFKRPGRDMNNSKDRKLDSQVEGYFEKLMESKAKNEKGQFLNLQDNTPKFGYVICDLHNELIEYNVKHNYFKKTPYNTLYKINPELNMYIEVMSYQTMLEAAEKRHDAFFRALGISNL